MAALLSPRILATTAIGLLGLACCGLVPGLGNLAFNRADAAEAKPLLVGAASSLSEPLQALADCEPGQYQSRPDQQGTHQPHQSVAHA